MNKTIQRISVTLMFLLVGISMRVDGQLRHPEPGFVYNDTELPRIDITIVQSKLDSLYADPWSDQEYKSQFRFTRNDTIEVVLDIGFRFRGNTSRDKDKKSFRVSFNTFIQGQDFYGIEEMNLNAETNDPSLIRSKLSWTLFRYLGVPSLRSNHVLLYINNIFYGVYINTEHVDENYVRSRFGNNDGNLYKCLWPADLTYLGDHQDAYKFLNNDRRAYRLLINEEWDDYEDLAGLIDTLTQYEGTALRKGLERVLNVQQYLKIMAVDVMTGNWDGYMGNKNNYYLYRDQVTGRFEYIPYDLDNTFGIDWLGIDWSNRSIYNWHRDERPLYVKILQVEEYKEQFTWYIKELAAFMTSNTLNQEMVRWKNQISTAVSQDTFYLKDWGYVYTDFENAYTTGWGGHIPYGVQEYSGLRATSALAECIPTDASPLISHARISPSPGRIDLDWTAEDNDPGFSTTLHYRIDGAEWVSVPVGTPTETDPVSGTQTYTYSILSLTDETSVDLDLTVMDQGGQETRYPFDYFTVSFPLIDGPLYINEFMASNSDYKMDEFWEYDDWVEIYNSSNAQVWLGDIYLSDNMGAPGRYRLPDTFIEPEGFYTVWLDSNPEQGPNHAPFKIKKAGEELRLSQRPAYGFSLIDSITFGQQETDISFGRSIDGGTEWIAFSGPTPGYSNLSTGWNEKPMDDHTLILYPNPVYDGVLIFNRRVSGSIYNLMGNRLMEIVDAEQVLLPSFAPGIYIFRSDRGESKPFTVVGN